jgi:hypothetical protein
LLSGEFGVFDWFEVDGIGLDTDERYAYEPFRLAVWGFYDGEGVTVPGEFERFGPLYRKAAILTPGSAPFSNVLPYTAYDRPDWDFMAHLANPYPEITRVAAMIYHPGGLLLEVAGDRVIPPYGKMTLDFQRDFERVKGRYAWILLLSDKPLYGMGLTQPRDGSSVDVFGFAGEQASHLYAPHLPSDTQTWETSAYVVWSDPDTDTFFDYRLSDGISRRIDGLRLPTSVGVLSDSHFQELDGRATWLEVQADDPVASGILFYSGRNDHSRLASVPMNAQPNTVWRYEHVGDHSRGWWNGLAVLNPADHNTVATVAGYRADGEWLTSVNIQLPSRTRVVNVLTDLLGETVEPVSRVEVQSEDPVITFLLLGRLDGSLLTTVAGNLPAAREMIVPHIPDLTRDWVGLALVNDGRSPRQVVLEPYSATGVPGEPVTLTVNASEKRLLSLGDVLPQGASPAHLIIRPEFEIHAYALTGDMAANHLATLPVVPVTPLPQPDGGP